MGILKRFDHVSIGVKDMDKARTLFCDILGGVALKDVGTSEKEGFDWFTFELGGKKMEVVSGHNADSGVGRYVEKYGEGFHHISIAVDNLEEAIEYFESKGVRVLAAELGEDTWKHCYLHPKDTFGAMIQVFEETEKTQDLAE